MARSITTRIGFEGEKEYQQACKDLDSSLRVMQSEMKLLTAEYGKDDDSIEALTKRQSALSKEYDLQVQKVAEIEKALSSLTASGKGSTEQINRFQIQLNNAKTQATQTKNEIDRLGDQIGQAGHEADEGADDLKSFGAQAESVGKDEKTASENADKLGTALNRSADNASSAREKFAKLNDVLNKIATVMGAAVAAAGAAAVKLGKDVVDQFGELEQNLGGSEAVFGKYAEEIQRTGEEAYKNLGASQSDYLASATKMGALFQGAGLSQQRSLELTEKAMQRAADMASVMGIDTSEALEAVTGAAKGNYTMMDNLGVAMSATNIQAYALSKGLDFTWNTATQAEKAEVAMQMFFDNTQQYAGNFAEEATHTVSGSIGLMQTSLLSFVAGLGNTNADIGNLAGNVVDAFKSMAGNIVPVLKNIISSLPEALDGISSALPELGEQFPTLANAIQKVVNVLKWIIENSQTVVGAIKGIGAGFAGLKVVSTVAPMISSLTTTIGGFASSITAAGGIGPALTALAAPAGPILAVGAAVVGLGLAFKNAYDNNEQFKTEMDTSWAGLQETVNGAVDKVKETAGTIWQGLEDNGTVDSVITTFKGIWDDISLAVGNAVKNITDGISGIVEGFTNLVSNIDTDAIIQAITDMWNIIGPIFQAIGDAISGVITIIGDLVKFIGDVASGDWKGAWEDIQDIVTTVSDTMKKIWTDLQNAFDALVKGIVNLGKSLGTNLQKAWDDIKAGLQWLWDDGFEWIAGKIGEFVGSSIRNITDWVHNMVEKFNDLKDQAKEKIQGLIDWFKDFPQKAADAVKGFVDKFIGAITGEGSGESLSTRMYNAATEAIQGFINGITDLGKNLWNKAKEIADSFLGGVQKGLDEHSPSKAMAQLGNFAIKGFIDGVDALSQQVKTAGADMSSDFVDAFGTPDLTASLTAPSASAATMGSGYGGGSAQSLVINTAGLFDGATITIRDSSDIDTLARKVVSLLPTITTAQNRTIGLVGV